MSLTEAERETLADAFDEAAFCDSHALLIPAVEAIIEAREKPLRDALARVEAYRNRCAILRVEPTTKGLHDALRADPSEV